MLTGCCKVYIKLVLGVIIYIGQEIPNLYIRIIEVRDFLPYVNYHPQNQLNINFATSRQHRLGIAKLKCL